MKTLKITCFAALLASTTSFAEDGKAVQAGTGFNFTVNNSRTFTVDDNTVLKKDGVIVPFSSVQAGTGFKTSYKVSGNGTDVANGTLNEINLINTHKGPITSLDPFRIFNIDVLVTADTFIDDNLDFNAIAINDELKISGFIDDNSNLLAGRIESDNDPLQEWKLSGIISALSATQFNIANQVVIIGGIIDDNCINGLINGEFVEIKATPDALFVAGSSLNTVTKIECVAQGIDTPPGDVLPVALEGFINALGVNGNFTIGNQDIIVTQNTTYINGEIDDIQVNVKVEVEGFIDTTTSVIQAVKVKFREVRFKFEVPLTSDAIVLNESITVLGQTIIVTPQLRDEDGYISGGIANSAQVEVRGFADSTGQLFATRVRDRGNIDFNDINIDGQLIEINRPLLIVYGITVDSSNSIFRNIDGTALSADEFYNLVSTGAQVEIDQASLDNMTNIVSGGIIQIDELNTVQNRVQTSIKGITSGLGIGTITNLADSVFSNSFD